MKNGVLKVAILNRNFFRSAGGAESYSVSIAEGLADHRNARGEHDFEVHVWSQNCDHNYPGITYHTVPGKIRRRWINQLWYSLYTWWHTRSGYDIVHSHENTWHGNVQTAHVRPVRYHLMEGLQGLKRVMRWLKIVTSPRLLFYVWVESARHAPKGNRVVVAVSDAVRQQTLLAFPSCDPQMPVIPPGVSKPNETLGQREAREQLGLPVDGTLILFCGNDYARKGLPHLLGALEEIRSQAGVSADLPHLVVVGDPSQIAQHKEKADALGVLNLVHFVGRCSDMAVAYRAADVLVHPTLEDSFAMVVLEAMNYGVPVIVSGPRYCGISAFLESGREAVLLDDPRDIEALAREIERVLSSDVLKRSLAEQGRAFAAQRQWSHSVELYAGLFKRMCGIRDAHAQGVEANNR